MKGEIDRAQRSTQIQAEDEKDELAARLAQTQQARRLVAALLKLKADELSVMQRAIGQQSGNDPDSQVASLKEAIVQMAEQRARAKQQTQRNQDRILQYREEIVRLTHKVEQLRHQVEKQQAKREKRLREMAGMLFK